MPEMHQNAFGGRAPPGPAGGAYALSRLPCRNEGVYFYREGGKGKEEGLLLRGTKKEKRGKRGRKWGIEGNASRINDGCSYFTMHYITN